VDCGTGVREIEAQDPFARDVLAVHGRGEKFPALSGAQCLVGEIFAGAGGVERGACDGARWFYFDSHTYADLSLNRVAGFLGDFGQGLLEDLAGNEADGW